MVLGLGFSTLPLGHTKGLLLVALVLALAHVNTTCSNQQHRSSSTDTQAHKRTAAGRIGACVAHVNTTCSNQQHITSSTDRQAHKRTGAGHITACVGTGEHHLQASSTHYKLN
jgi:hypothetical protein